MIDRVFFWLNEIFEVRSVVVVADEVVGGIRGRGGNDHPMKMVMIIERIAIKIFLNLWTNYDDRGCERKTNEKKDIMKYDDEVDDEWFMINTNNGLLNRI